MPVGIALLVAGLATYAFFKIGKVALGGDAEFQPISALWFATFSLAPGFFLPLEQELGRALSHRKARGEGGHPVVERVVRANGNGFTGYVRIHAGSGCPWSRSRSATAATAAIRCNSANTATSAVRPLPSGVRAYQ